MSTRGREGGGGAERRGGVLGGRGGGGGGGGQQQGSVDGSSSKLIAVISDEDTVSGLLLAGIGHSPPHTPHDKLNFFVVTDKTTPGECEATFRRFAARHDVAVILIAQYVADMIRPAVDAHGEYKSESNNQK